VSRIKISNLTKSYGSATVIDGLDLDIAEGEFITLLGPSGCGKTTTLRSVAGLETPDTGRITIGDKIVTCMQTGVALPPNKRSLGMVFQSYAIWPHMSVFDNVAYPLRRKGFSSRELRAKVMTSLESVGLAHAATRLATQLSGGQQQRVALARAIVADPAVLLFDEPLSNLDAQLRISMRDEIMRLRGKGRTSLYVTHDQAEAFALSDRVAVMFDGKIVQLDTAQEIVARPVSLAVATFLGIENLIPGTVITNTKGEALVDAPSIGCRLRVTRGAEAVSSGDPVTLAIRASHALVGTHKFQENSCSGRVVQVTFLGDGFQYRIQVGTHQVLVRTTLDEVAQFHNGEEVHVAFPTDHLSVFTQSNHDASTSDKTLEKEIAP
jgi:iron(III) transport system ATP-binding protein